MDYTPKNGLWHHVHASLLSKVLSEFRKIETLDSHLSLPKCILILILFIVVKCIIIHYNI